MRRAETILAELDAARWDLQQLEDHGEVRPLRVLAFATAIASFAPDAIADLRRTLPEVVVELRLSGDTQMGAAAMRGDRLDVALVNSDGRPVPDARVQLVREDPMWCCLPVGHPLTERESVPIAALRTEPFVLTADTLCADRTLVLDACEAAGFRPRVGAHCDDPATRRAWSRPARGSRPCRRWRCRGSATTSSCGRSPSRCAGASSRSSPRTRHRAAGAASWWPRWLGRAARGAARRYRRTLRPSRWMAVRRPPIRPWCARARRSAARR